jgi:hypothetical protein
MRKIEINPQNNRPPWTKIDHQKKDFGLCSIVREYNNQRFRAVSSRILKEKYESHTNIYTDGSNKEEELGGGVNNKKGDTSTELNITVGTVGDHKPYI